MEVFMFNNKKRLLSTFIAALTVCPVANGMETKNDFKMVTVPEFKKNGNAYIREFQGPALDGLRAKYERIDNGKVFAGHAGVVSPYKRKADGKIVAVKCIADPTKTGMKTDHVQEDSIKKEIEFFNKIKEYKEHPGIVNCYDIFSDDNVTYIVQDWIDGTTLCDLPAELKKQSFAWKKKFIYQFIKKILKTTVFVEEKLKVKRTDPHEGNCMIAPFSPDEINFAKKYSEFNVYFVDWGECIKLEDKALNKKPNFVDRFDYGFVRRLIWLANEKLGLNFKRSFTWRCNSSEVANLLKDFLLKCDKSPMGNGPIFSYGEIYDEDGVHYKGDDQPIFFQSYKEIYDFCDAKIKEAENEIGMSK